MKKPEEHKKSPKAYKQPPQRKHQTPITTQTPVSKGKAKSGLLETIIIAAIFSTIAGILSYTVGYVQSRKSYNKLAAEIGNLKQRDINRYSELHSIGERFTSYKEKTDTFLEDLEKQGLEGIVTQLKDRSDSVTQAQTILNAEFIAAKAIFSKLETSDTLTATEISNIKEKYGKELTVATQKVVEIEASYKRLAEAYDGIAKVLSDIGIAQSGNEKKFEGLNKTIAELTKQSGDILTKYQELVAQVKEIKLKETIKEEMEKQKQEKEKP